MLSDFLNPARKLALTCALLVVSAAAFATNTLTFDGDDYFVEIVVGSDSGDVVGQVLFTPPGQKSAIALPRGKIQLVRYDSGLRMMELRYRNAGDTGLPASFGLTVQRDTGFLDIEGRRIRGAFDWSM